MGSSILSILLLCTYISIKSVVSESFLNTFVIWDNLRTQISPDGEQLTLAIDRQSGSGVKFKRQFHFGRFDVLWKMPRGNTAGIVSTFYLQSPGDGTQDEIDLEFLGNTTGNPYVLHTNIFGKGEGGREQQFYLWFDPTEDFHIYSIIWNPFRIIILVDEQPIREHRNVYRSVPRFVYPTRPMSLYATIWDAGTWADLGVGFNRTDYADAPYVATYRNFKVDSCEPGSRCDPTRTWWNHEIDNASHKRMLELQKQYMIYNYCNDPPRFKLGLPPECFYRP